ncbi:MAG: hypothetical protein ACREEE_04545, partial [Dongiaceae bacterium]
EFYESRRPGLGLAFVAEVERAAKLIVLRPTAGAPTGTRFRRILVRRFPFAIIYRQLDGVIQIIAVAHLHRNPGYWRGRATP